MRLQFLQADGMPGLDAREPAREPFSLGGADAVDVESDDPHEPARVYKTARPAPAKRQNAAGTILRANFNDESTGMSNFRRDFLEFALAREVLRFGQFTTKAGRDSPYFFDAGLFNDGESLRRLGSFYAQALRDSGMACDQLFGPAYKGIPLASATAIAL